MPETSPSIEPEVTPDTRTPHEKGWDTRRNKYPPTILELARRLLEEQAGERDRNLDGFLKLTPVDMACVMQAVGNCYADYFKNKKDGKDGRHGFPGITTEELEEATELVVEQFEVMDRDPIAWIRYKYSSTARKTYWRFSIRGKWVYQHYGSHDIAMAALPESTVLGAMKPMLEKVNARAKGLVDKNSESKPVPEAES